MRTLSQPVEFEAPSAVWSFLQHRVRMEPYDGDGWVIGKNDVAIPATIGHVIPGRMIGIPTNATIGLGYEDETVQIVEHPLALRPGLGLDSVRFRLLDNAMPYIAAPGKIGEMCLPLLEGTPAPKHIADSYYFEDPQTGTSLHYAPEPRDRLVVKIRVVYPPPINFQELTWEGDPESFLVHAHARTRLRNHRHQVIARISRALGGLLTMANECLTPEETAKDPRHVVQHRLIDLLGSIGLVPQRMVGMITSVKAGHRHDLVLARHLARTAVCIEKPVAAPITSSV